MQQARQAGGLTDAAVAPVDDAWFGDMLKAGVYAKPELKGIMKLLHQMKDEVGAEGARLTAPGHSWTALALEEGRNARTPNVRFRSFFATRRHSARCC